MLNKILVIQTSFIGDAILASSIIEKLQQHYPKAEIEMLVRKGNESLYDKHPYLERCYTWNKDKKYRSLFQIIRKLRKKNYDLVVNLHRFASSGLITTLLKANQKVGFKKNPLSRFYSRAFNHIIGDGTHEIERNHQLIAAITDPKPAAPRLYPNKDSQNKIDKLAPQNYFCIAPCSVWPTKELPFEHWVELINKLPEESNKFLIGSSRDFQRCEELKNQCSGKHIYNRCAEDSLLDTTYLMQGAKMNYVNDSAPLHLASAGNSAVTAFFCSTIPEFGFTPWSDHVRVIEKKEKLYCRPCGIHGKKACPEGHFQCGKDITLPDLPD